jgi:hypothetical protein
MLKDAPDSAHQHDDAAQTTAAMPFTLDPGDRIKDCSALWGISDRVVEELGTCRACGGPTFRVITIASAAKLERRAALCEPHFAMALQEFPELDQGQNPGAA